MVKKFLLLCFDIPRGQSYLRTKTWRKLKKSGASLRLGSYWELPFSKENLERMESISGEINRLGGKSEVIKGEKVD